MHINLKTKFNIGDKVWVPDHYYDWYPLKTERIISDFEIKISSQNQKIFYIIKDCDKNTDRYPERLCFGSYEECKQWCDKENK